MKQLLKVTFSDETHTVDIMMFGSDSEIQKVRVEATPPIKYENIHDSLVQSFAIGYANSLLDISKETELDTHKPDYLIKK